MRKLANFSSLFLICAILFIQCDATSSPPSITPRIPTISGFVVEPNSVNFNKELDGFKDTTLSVELRVHVAEELDEFRYTYNVVNLANNTIFHTGDLHYMSTAFYSDVFAIETSTTNSLNLMVEMFAFDEKGNKVFAQSYIEINGFSNAAPRIIFAENPENVTLPADGEKTVVFKAKVTDDDGQNTIDGVFLRLISQTSGEVSGSPFALLDNGTQEDEMAADSIYTVNFTINSTNEPQTYDILYYAKDLGGLVSDTVQTTFRISSN